MYYTFVSFDIDVKHFISPLTMKDYVLIYIHGIDDMIFGRGNNFATTVALALGAIGITAARGAWQDKFFHMIVLAGICAAARFVILPQHFERAFSIPDIMVLIAFVYLCRALLEAAPPTTGEVTAAHKGLGC